MIAMALSCKPRLLIADEPTTAIDVTTQAQILALLRELQRKYQTAIIFITHDLGVIAQMAHYVVVMYLGRVMEERGRWMRSFIRRCTRTPLKALLRSIPSLQTEVRAALPVIAGALPHPFNCGPLAARSIRVAKTSCASAVPWRFLALHSLRPRRAVSCFLLTATRPNRHDRAAAGRARTAEILS